MQKGIILFVSLLVSTCLMAQNGNGNGNQNNQGQGNTQWKTNGNNADVGDYIGTKNDRPVIFKSNDNERIRISSDGYVGVGTSNPQTKLDVDGEATFRTSVYLPNLTQENGLDEVVFIDQNGTLKMGTVEGIGEQIYEPRLCPTGDIQNPMWSNGVNKIFVRCPQIFVGIGTDTPLHKLDVRGNTYLSGSMGLGAEPSPTDVQLLLKTQLNREVGICVDQDVSAAYSYAFKAIVHDEETKGIGIYNDAYNKDIFTVYSNGKIEVSNYAGKILQLEADGILRARKVKVDLDTWPDYVFDDQYTLMPLSKVEEFIESEHHLPNVPSEQEITTEGLDLGEMNKILLEKVEELTLYTIQQQKEIDQLRQEMKELKK